MVEPPPGGPVDITPPHLVTMAPDSGAVDLVNLKTVRLTFSEKMDRTSAVSWLHFFPDQRIRQTKWHGAIEAEVVLEHPLPADTVIVVEVAGGMRDAHKVKNQQSRRWPIATGDSIPPGNISGVLIMADSAVTLGVVELYDVPPDTVEYFQQPLLRRTTTDANGAYRFDWLPVPGGPWLLRAFADPDNNLRPGERDAQRLVPDTLSLTAAEPAASPGVTTLYAFNTPGRVLVGPFDSPPEPGPVRAWSLAVADDDTGWTAAPEDGQRNPIYPLSPTAGGTLEEVAPGLARIIFFVDVDGDSLFGGVPDSLLTTVPDSVRAAAVDTAETGLWFLEPYAMAEGIEVEPGLATVFEPGDLTFTITPWDAPPPPAAPADTLRGAEAIPAAGDTLTADEESE